MSNVLDERQKDFKRSWNFGTLGQNIKLNRKNKTTEYRIVMI